MSKLHTDSGQPFDRGDNFTKDLYYHLTDDHGCSFRSQDFIDENRRPKGREVVWSMLLSVHCANHHVEVASKEETS